MDNGCGRLKRLRTHLSELADTNWDFTAPIMSLDSEGRVVGCALGQCNTLWPEYFLLVEKSVQKPAITKTEVKGPRRTRSQLAIATKGGSTAIIDLVKFASIFFDIPFGDAIQIFVNKFNGQGTTRLQMISLLDVMIQSKLDKEESCPQT